jgi:protocatechuate 3,4-dioxygenase alpha subunit
MTPSRELVSAESPLTVSPFCTIGPFFPYAFVDGLEDLTHFGEARARGQQIVISGRVLQEGGGPTKNTILEIWQPDAEGIFRHSLDPRCSQADPGFRGWGRARTDAQGSYHFRTVLPGSYTEDGRVRCPHINVMLLAIGLTRRVVTTIFFADRPDQVSDPVLDCVPQEARGRLFAVRKNASDDPAAAIEYGFDVVLRGDQETPFFLD